MSDLSALERAILRKQAFDNEFEIEVAAQNNYTGANDMADVARYHGFDHLDGTQNINYKGFYVDPDKSGNEGLAVGQFSDPIKGWAGGVRGELPTEVGTVNAVHNQANPLVWAHEYRHRDLPRYNERTNRTLDFMSAINQGQQDYAVRGMNEYDRTRLKRDQAPSETLIDLLKHSASKMRTVARGPYQSMIELEWERGARSTPLGKAKDIDDYIDQRHDSAFFQKTFDEMDEYLDWNELSRRNLQRRINALPVTTMYGSLPSKSEGGC